MWDIAKHYDMCLYCLNTVTGLAKRAGHQLLAYLKPCSVTSVIPYKDTDRQVLCDRSYVMIIRT